MTCRACRSFPNYGCFFGGLSIVRIILCWGLYVGLLIQGNYYVMKTSVSQVDFWKCLYTCCPTIYCIWVPHWSPGSYRGTQSVYKIFLSVGGPTLQSLPEGPHHAAWHRLLIQPARWRDVLAQHASENRPYQIKALEKTDLQQWDPQY